MLIDQVYTNYAIQVAKFIETASNPQVPAPMKAHLMQVIENKGKSLAKFLEASDVDEIEEFIFNLKEAQGGNINGLQQLGAGDPNQAAGPEGPVQRGGLEAISGGGGAGPRRTPRAGGIDSLYD